MDCPLRTLEHSQVKERSGQLEVTASNRWRSSKATLRKRESCGSNFFLVVWQSHLNDNGMHQRIAPAPRLRTNGSSSRKAFPHILTASVKSFSLKQAVPCAFSAVDSSSALLHLASATASMARLPSSWLSERASRASSVSLCESAESNAKPKFRHVAATRSKGTTHKASASSSELSAAAAVAGRADAACATSEGTNRSSSC